uniref:ATP synthase complex subunit 8 n=1 Tax=Pseudophylus stundjuki TaxID=863833 RepID=A0A514LQK0_9HEMI|nr:ATP synthase F0 subunit 8 [Pseudophylus stundjuki]QDI94092.1 ATP synthase F0 subunit 8 [Pseudophylus stundjuki]
MPQMSPMWWLPLFLMFLTVYLFFMASMYSYNVYSNKNNSSPKHSNIKKNNWKW